jgi:hypothetical protein
MAHQLPGVILDTQLNLGANLISKEPIGLDFLFTVLMEMIEEVPIIAGSVSCTLLVEPSELVRSL